MTKLTGFGAICPDWRQTPGHPKPDERTRPAAGIGAQNLQDREASAIDSTSRIQEMEKQWQRQCHISYAKYFI
ncbi:MAG: hypothetical protein ACRD2L_20915 [Terriglobia bacterium]